MADVVKSIDGQDGGTAFNGRTSIKTGRKTNQKIESNGYYTFAHAEFDDNAIGTDLSARLDDVRYYTGDSPTDTP